MFYIQATCKIYSEKFFKSIWIAIKVIFKAVFKGLLHGLKKKIAK